MGSDRNPELISGLCAVDHLEEFNRINVAFVHAELSFCVGSRFCLSLWRWRCGRGNSGCSTDLWNREANREERTVLAQVLWFGFKCLPTQIQLLSVGRLSSGICSVIRRFLVGELVNHSQKHIHVFLGDKVQGYSCCL